MYTLLSRTLLSFSFVACTLSPASAQTLSFAAPPSLFEDLTPGQATFLHKEFPRMLREFTGLEASLLPRMSIDAIGDNLAAGTDSFAVLQGVEYGWLKSKHPEIQPLLVGIYHVTQPRALLLTKKDDSAKSFDDFKGRTVAVLKGGKEHIYLFQKKGAGGDPGKFFGKIIATPNGETCLDDVLLGTAAGAIVDQATLDSYKEVNPGRFSRLRVVDQSPLFPPMGVFYVPGKVPENALQQLRAGMLKAAKDERGRDSMATFKITSFEQVPSEYATWVADSVKAYPRTVLK
jgi:ABC-type phosphate/phosphonate transport system substrate-binding protein